MMRWHSKTHGTKPVHTHTPLWQFTPPRSLISGVPSIAVSTSGLVSA